MIERMPVKDKRGSRALYAWIVVLAALLVLIGMPSYFASSEETAINLIGGLRAEVDHSALEFDDFVEITPDYYSALTDGESAQYAWFVSPSNRSSRFDVSFTFDMGAERIVGGWTYDAVDVGQECNFSHVQPPENKYKDADNGLYRSMAAKEIRFELSGDGQTWQTVDHVKDNRKCLLTRALQTSYRARYVRFVFVKGSEATEKWEIADPCVSISELGVTEGTAAENVKPVTTSYDGAIAQGDGSYTFYGRIDKGGFSLTEIYEYGIKLGYFENGKRFVETVALHVPFGEEDSGTYSLQVRDIPAGTYEVYTFALVGESEVYSASQILEV